MTPPLHIFSSLLPPPYPSLSVETDWMNNTLWLFSPSQALMGVGPRKLVPKTSTFLAVILQESLTPHLSGSHIFDERNFLKHYWKRTRDHRHGKGDSEIAQSPHINALIF